MYQKLKTKLIKLITINRYLQTSNQQKKILMDFLQYPVLDLNTLLPISYQSTYTQLKSIIKLDTQNKYQVIPKHLNNFMANQIIKDYASLSKNKEIIFIGRSNSGKSSLLNELLDKKVSTVSKKQGSTRKLYFNELEKNRGLLVDAPGYGFTQTSVQSREQWFKMMNDYMKTSSRLCQIYMLINLQHGIKDSDKEVLEKLRHYHIKVKIVMTKCDRLKTIDAIYDKTTLEIQKLQSIGVSKIVDDQVHVTSARSRIGIEELKESLVYGLQNYQPRCYDDKEHEVLYQLLGYIPKQIQTDLKAKTMIQHQQRQQQSELQKIKSRRRLS